ncbi:MAG: hypothetical protein HRU20_05590 [Pseudomonadales bacterium]|nr:hypothetical protein [Pseudomonadales bacterium]
MPHPFNKYLWATSLAIAPISFVHAIGLGNLQHQSALGLPLSASIPILGSKTLTPRDIHVAIGEKSDYQSLNVEWDFSHQDIQVLPLAKDGQLYIKLKTVQPINEPFLNFVVTLDSVKGRMSREYTILLDLPSVLSAPTAIPQTPAVKPAITRKPATNIIETQAPTSAQSPNNKTYTIQRGDSLWRLGKALRPNNTIPVSQMMNAIFEKNKQAFIHADPNRIKLAYTIHLPDAKEIAQATNRTPIKSKPIESNQVAHKPAEIQQLMHQPTETQDNTALFKKIAALEAKQQQLMHMLEQRNKTLQALQAQIQLKDSVLPVPTTTPAVQEERPVVIEASHPNEGFSIAAIATQFKDQGLFFSLILATAALMLMMIPAYFLLRTVGKTKTNKKSQTQTDGPLPYWKMPMQDLSHVKSTESKKTIFNRPQLSLVNEEKELDTTALELSELSITHGAYETAINILSKEIEKDPENNAIQAQLLKAYAMAENKTELALASEVHESFKKTRDARL